MPRRGFSMNPALISKTATPIFEGFAIKDLLIKSGPRNTHPVTFTDHRHHIKRKNEKLAFIFGPAQETHHGIIDVGKIDPFKTVA